MPKYRAAASAAATGAYRFAAKELDSKQPRLFIDSVVSPCLRRFTTHITACPALLPVIDVELNLGRSRLAAQTRPAADTVMNHHAPRETPI
jgi:hypothetical protein